MQIEQVEIHQILFYYELEELFEHKLDVVRLDKHQKNKLHEGAFFVAHFEFFANYPRYFLDRFSHLDHHFVRFRTYSPEFVVVTLTHL
jgi:hypothetical protein